MSPSTPHADGEAGATTAELAVHPKLLALFRALDDAGARWCVLRGETDLLHPAGDVDLLVARDDFGSLQQSAGSLGFVRLPAWGHGSHAFFLAYDASDDSWIKLDVVTELAYGPAFSLATRAESECLDRRRRVAGVPVPDEADAFWTLFLHRLLDKNGPPPAYEAGRLVELSPRGRERGPLERLVASLCPDGWNTERIMRAVERGEWDALDGLAEGLLRAWRRLRGAEVRRREAAERFWRRSGKWLRLTRRPGIRVALLGPDGAGKSTLKDDLERSFYFPVRSVYMGLYQNPVPRSARRRLRVPRWPQRVVTQWGRWTEGTYHQRRGRLVVFDRYTYDAQIPNRFRHGRRGQARRWILAHCCPSPDLVVVLDAPGEVLYSRKGEHDLVLLDRQREAYRSLVERLPRSVVVSTLDDRKRVQGEVTAAIWREYVRRWSNGE